MRPDLLALDVAEIADGADRLGRYHDLANYDEPIRTRSSDFLRRAELRIRRARHRLDGRPPLPIETDVAAAILDRLEADGWLEEPEPLRSAVLAAILEELE